MLSSSRGTDARPYVGLINHAVTVHAGGGPQAAAAVEVKVAEVVQKLTSRVLELDAQAQADGGLVVLVDLKAQGERKYAPVRTALPLLGTKDQPVLASLDLLDLLENAGLVLASHPAGADAQVAAGLAEVIGTMRGSDPDGVWSDLETAVAAAIALEG